MQITKIKISNFRNYEFAEVDLASRTNIFFGDNAQGKTNLLEAISVASVAKSFRTPRDKELIRWGADKAKITIFVESKLCNDKVEIVLDRSANKRIAISDTPISRLGELMGVIRSVLFSPDEMKIVKESPAERRRFIDIALCQLSKSYFYELSRYNRILSHRNKLLKGKGSKDEIDVWDLQLSSSGAKIIDARRKYVGLLSGYALEAHDYLTAGSEKLALKYEGIEGDGVEATRLEFLRALQQSYERDIYMGYTHVGPHKDDMSLKVSDIDLRSYGSQGQQRTASLSLKIAEMELSFARTGEYPILLLDDVLSELDEKRQTLLAKRLGKNQTIITCTHIEPFIERNLAMKKFIVKSGLITPLGRE